MVEHAKILLKKYALLRLKMDFMGYQFETVDDLAFHHLIIPRKDSERILRTKGYHEWNGAFLVRYTSHEYLHLIEKYDYKMFLAITSEIIDQKNKGYISFENIRIINEILNEFECNYKDKRHANGKLIIRESYTKRLYK